MVNVKTNVLNQSVSFRLNLCFSSVPVLDVSGVPTDVSAEETLGHHQVPAPIWIKTENIPHFTGRFLPINACAWFTFQK